MSDMKLIMESWKNYSEQELNEQQLDEGLKDMLKKLALGTVAFTSLMGQPAMAQDLPTNVTKSTVTVRGGHPETQTRYHLGLVTSSLASGNLPGDKEIESLKLVKELGLVSDADLNEFVQLVAGGPPNYDEALKKRQEIESKLDTK